MVGDRVTICSWKECAARPLPAVRAVIMGDGSARPLRGDIMDDESAEPPPVRPVIIMGDERTCSRSEGWPP